MVGEIVDQDEEPIIRRRDYQRQQQPDQQQEPQQESQEPDQQEQHDQRIYKVSPINCAKVFTLLFAFRAYNAILVSTWFDPDEIYAPKLLQAAFAAITDGFAFLLAFRMFGLETARWTLSCMIMSWFNSYCLIRTYSNSLEASLTIVALYFWPIPRNPPPTRGEFRISLAIAALCCIIRVTNSLIWIFLGIQMLRTYPHRRAAIFFDVIVTG
ncbi:hypothetical protein HDV02_006180 [Globomyces sp. JEL0801]|nr:hypothetical protein HDV02_006180 [Globomyces sp. JEL0801]